MDHEVSIKIKFLCKFYSLLVFMLEPSSDFMKINSAGMILNFAVHQLQNKIQN